MIILQFDGLMLKKYKIKNICINIYIYVYIYRYEYIIHDKLINILETVALIPQRKQSKKAKKKPQARFILCRYITFKMLIDS